MHLSKPLRLRSVSLFTSALLHVSGLLLLGIYFDFSPATYKLGNENTQIVTSYLYQDAETHLSVAQKKSVATVEKSHAALNEKGLRKKREMDKQIARASASHALAAASPAPQVASHGRSASELVALLHAAIQAQQHYPQAALQMEREGRVTLAFTLFANGNIDHLRIVKSSGTESLDEAAMAAVHDAAPFKQVNHYLEQAGEYHIDVAFELT